MNDIAPHLLTAAERIIGSERHKLSNDIDFIRAVAIAYEAIGFGATNDEILQHADAVFAEIQANAVPSAELVPSKQPISQTAINEARAAAQRQGIQNGVIAERNRIRTILSDPISTDRMNAAKHLAFNTDMTAAAALALLFTIKSDRSADALRNIPATIARACNAQGGLVQYVGETEALAASAATSQQGNEPSTNALLCAVEATPDPHAATRINSGQNNKALWKRATDALNAATDHSVQA